jgi:hypothetical protein
LRPSGPLSGFPGLSLAAVLLAGLGLLALGPERLLADEDIGLSYSGAGGALAIYAAIENGFFEEEGLKVKPVKASAEEIPGLLGSGAIVGGEIDYTVYKVGGRGPALSGGLFSGFVEILGESPGKGAKAALVTESVGSGPAVAAARELKGRGVDTKGAVTWLEAPLDQLEATVGRGEASVLARWEKSKRKGGATHGQNGEAGQGGAAEAGQGHGPEDGQARAKGQAQANGHGEGHGDGHGHGHGHGEAEGQGPGEAEGHGHGHGHGGHGGKAGGTAEAPEQGLPVLFSARATLPHDDGGQPSANPHAKHTSDHHLFESFVFVGRDYAKKDPEGAAAVTRALIRGATWVGENKEAAAELGLRHSIWQGDKGTLFAEIDSYMWMPGVKHAKEHIRLYIREWVERGLFPADTDEDSLYETLFIQVLPDLN